MHCDAILLMLDPYLDGDLTDAQNETIALHLRNCDGCARKYEAAKSMQENLVSLNAIGAPAGAFERLSANAALCAADAQYRRHRFYAAAAAILIVLCIPLLKSTDVVTSVPTAVLQLGFNETDQVYLVFESAHQLDDATVTVRLPPEIELRGYPGRRSLQWRTTLYAGKNKLTLPVVAVLDVPGRTRLIASVSHADRSKEYAVPIDLIGRQSAETTSHSPSPSPHPS